MSFAGRTALITGAASGIECDLLGEIRKDLPFGTKVILTIRPYVS